MKACRDCEHFRWGFWEDKCAKAVDDGDYGAISKGKVSMYSCEHARRRVCGADAEMFEQREYKTIGIG